MSLLQWKIETKEGTVLKDEISIFKGGPVHVVKEVPAGETFKRVSAQIRMPLSEDGRVFMNGYQSNTYVPERTGRDAIRGLMLMHQAIVDKNSYDRYGDYHFVEYPNRRGTTHGFSWCYFREGERFQLIASLDERPGYTMFTYEAPQERLTIERDCRNVTCTNIGDGFHAFDLFFAEGSEQEVFDAWFEALQIKARTSERLAGITTAHLSEQGISAESILKELEGASRVLEKGDLVLIDDGWETYVGDWFPNAKAFPDGMKQIADAIHERTGIEVRVTVPGHMQRGGAPSCKDRYFASIMGSMAVQLLLEGKTNRLVCYQHGDFCDVDIMEGLAMTKPFPEEQFCLTKTLTR